MPALQARSIRPAATTVPAKRPQVSLKVGRKSPDERSRLHLSSSLSSSSPTTARPSRAPTSAISSPAGLAELRHVRTRHHAPETNGVVERFNGSPKYEHLYRLEIPDLLVPPRSRAGLPGAPRHDPTARGPGLRHADGALPWPFTTRPNRPSHHTYREPECVQST